ncbi:hypothetical protein [Streptomyces albidus (ex Kaewkla and Franco 2022)]|uniref:hypothetical protein n=1 Tax=Streptomyces albidus (ex Kaewkla and Franco 2022) TaxID=722709 RepID=UPI0015EFBE64|nr:hypothetical protein [Streptomyces albidus (ex Kaewkla and Franco 2022)]
MRKLREAAVVATMVGSVSVLGAGVAYAGGAHELPTINCEQDAAGNTVVTNIDGVTTIATTGAAGDADSSAVPQNCGTANENNLNTSGDTTGGTGTAALAE